MQLWGIISTVLSGNPVRDFESSPLACLSQLGHMPSLTPVAVAYWLTQGRVLLETSLMKTSSQRAGSAFAPARVPGLRLPGTPRSGLSVSVRQGLNTGRRLTAHSVCCPWVVELICFVKHPVYPGLSSSGSDLLVGSAGYSSDAGKHPDQALNQGFHSHNCVLELSILGSGGDETEQIVNGLEYLAKRKFI